MDAESTQSPELVKPSVLFHASENRGVQEFEPRNRKSRDPNEGPTVFATPDKAVASLFIVPTDGSWVASGLHNSVPYIAISDKTRFDEMDKGGAIYSVPPETFGTDLNKGMGEYEWTSKVPVQPLNEEIFESGMEAMIGLGVQVYFLDRQTFEDIQNSSDHGLVILKNLRSENQKLNKNFKPF